MSSDILSWELYWRCLYVCHLYQCIAALDLVFFIFLDSLFLSNLEDKLFRRNTRILFLPFHSQILLFTNLCGSSFTSGRLRQSYHSTELSIDHPVLYVLLSLLSLAHILTRQGQPRSGKTKLRVSANSMSRILQAPFPITRQHLSTPSLFPEITCSYVGAWADGRRVVE